ncbi:MAG: hypothetical protein K0S26_670 [Bacteroidota bacterium]|jgi:predicted nucleotide-binding protein|nr:hypothetical protein [Bacteroidota bacterium]
MLSKDKRIGILNRQINKLSETSFSHNTWLLETTNLLERVFAEADNKKRQLESAARQPGAEIIGLNIAQLKTSWQQLLEGYIYEVELDDDTHPNQHNSQPSISIKEKNEVFIVHGQDEAAKEKVARFIHKLGLKPIILHEQASSGKTIIEKIEEYTNVDFGIVLYTPCDIGGKQADPPNIRPRARQNVVFEHGYLIGRIGRKNVCALVKGDVETPNDISGVVYVPMDDADAWHMKIFKELKNSGYAVDANNVI